MEAVKEVLELILDKLDAIERKLAEGAGSPRVEFTRRIQNDKGDWVYDVTGLEEAKDRETGEPGHWVKTKKGKNLLVSKKGYPIFLGPEERPDHPEAVPF